MSKTFYEVKEYNPSTKDVIGFIILLAGIVTWLSLIGLAILKIIKLGFNLFR